MVYNHILSQIQNMTYHCLYPITCTVTGDKCTSHVNPPNLGIGGDLDECKTWAEFKSGELFRITNKSSINTGVSNRWYTTKFSILTRIVTTFDPKYNNFLKRNEQSFSAKRNKTPSPQSFSYQCHNTPLALSPSARRVWMWGPNVSCQLKFWPFVRKRARLFTVPYFFVSSSGSSAYRYGRPSWFYVCRGAGVGVHGRGREAIKIVPLSSLLPKPSPPAKSILHSSKMAARNTSLRSRWSYGK